MHFSLLPATLLLSLAAAQTITLSGTASACPAQPVLEVCLASTEAIAQICATSDYQCLCQKWTSVLTCFDQCPNDPRQPSVLSEQETYCNDESVYDPSTTTPVSVAASSTAAPAVTTGSGSQTAGSVAAQTASGTSSSPSSTATGKSGAGSNAIIGAGQMVLGLAGFVAAFL